MTTINIKLEGRGGNDWREEGGREGEREGEGEGEGEREK